VVSKGPKPVLSREQAIAIRDVYAGQRAGTTTLAARYGVSVSLISRVIKGQYSPVADLPDIARQGLRSVPGRFSIHERKP
jgi:hypothetical protein